MTSKIVPQSRKEFIAVECLEDLIKELLEFIEEGNLDRSHWEDYLKPLTKAILASKD